MKKLGCGSRNARGNNINLLEQIFGKSRQTGSGKQRKRSAVSAEDSLRNYNTYRTICVRTCDGYHFPVSFSTRSDKFDDDADACTKLCPGAPMELYYHRTSGETVDDMISLIDGRRYLDSPTAFTYKKRLNPSCTCNYRLLDRSLATVDENELDGRDESELSPLEKAARTALPSFRPIPGDDPETVLSSIGGVRIDDLVVLIRPKTTRKKTGNRQVRVIGEEFLPVQ